jgi:hypothetical protein
MWCIRFTRGGQTRRHEPAKVAAPAPAPATTRSPVVETLEGRQLCAADAGFAVTAALVAPVTPVGPLPAAEYAAVMKAQGRTEELTRPATHVALGNDTSPTVPLDPVTRPVRYWSSTGGNESGGGWLRTEYRVLR